MLPLRFYLRPSDDERDQIAILLGRGAFGGLECGRLPLPQSSRGAYPIDYFHIDMPRFEPPSASSIPRRDRSDLEVRFR